jgi:hypothetical protein
MSTPVNEESAETTSMYAPPWARDAARDVQDARASVRSIACEAIDQALKDAPAAAAENAVAASEQFRRTLPPATRLGERRERRREKPFEGDLAIVAMRERNGLEPDAVPPPPTPERRSPVGLVARFAGAAGLAALAAFFMVGTAPFSFAVKAEGEAVTPSLWSRLTAKPTRSPATEVPREVALASISAPVPVPAPAPAVASTPAPAQVNAPAPLAERFAAVPPMVEQQVSLPARPAQTAAAPTVSPPAPAPAPAPSVRLLDPEEIAMLFRRSQDLIAQGDITGGRLLLTRAAEAGDARSALALGATYDPSVLGKMGVLGVLPDRERARTWYEKAAQFGSGEATKRLEVLAQAKR